MHHAHPHSSSIQGSPTNADVGHNLSAIANLTGLPVNNATAAAIIAAHGHHSTVNNPYLTSSVGSIHNQTAAQVLGSTGSGLFPHLSQYFSSVGGSSGSSNGAFSSYSPLAAHLKAAFPSMFPNLYIHTHHPSVFSPPPIIPPPPLLSPQRSNLSHNLSSGIVRPLPTKQTSSSLVANKDENKKAEDAFSENDSIKSNKLESENEKDPNQCFSDGRNVDVQEENSPSSTPTFNNNNINDCEKSLKDRLNLLFSKSHGTTSINSQITENCGIEKIDHMVYKEKEDTLHKTCKKRLEETSSEADSYDTICNKNDREKEANNGKGYEAHKMSNEKDTGEDLEIKNKCPSPLHSASSVKGKNTIFHCRATWIQKYIMVLIFLFTLFYGISHYISSFF